MGLTSSKNPMAGRLFAAAMVLAPAIAHGQEGAWSEVDAVERALSNPDRAAVLASRLREAQAETAIDTVIATPTLGLSFEQVVGAVDVASSEFSATVEQPLDLSGWRGHVRDALPHREAALRAEAEAQNLEIAAQVREAFFEVLFRQRRLEVLDGWIARLREGVEAASAREARGDTSLYAVRRVERALDTAHAQRASEQARLAEAWSALGRWVPWTSRPSIEGDLAPEAPTQRGGLALPGLARLEALGLELSAQERALGSPSLRGWAVGAGYRFVDAGEAGHGFIVTLSAPLALWDTDAPKIERLRAHRAELSAELNLLRTQEERAADAAQERLTQTIEALAKLPGQERGAELTRLAQIAYAAGEATLTELLEAHEGEAELELSRLDLQWESRRAAIELDLRQGRGVTP